MIFWGPPGVGKTTLAKIIAETTKASFIEFSAVMSGIKEIKQVMVDAAKAAELHSRTILFVDEIHRFNKAQQDAFLPYVERGTIRADRRDHGESFVRDHLRAAVALPRLRAGAAQRGADRDAAASARWPTRNAAWARMELTADDDALELIAGYSSGDCRNAYNALEVAAQLADSRRQQAHHEGHRDRSRSQQRVLLYDKRARSTTT